MAAESRSDQMTIEILRTNWSKRMHPYRSELLALRDIALWNSKPALVTVSLVLHVFLYVFDHALTNSTILSSILLFIGLAIPASFLVPNYLRSLHAVTPADDDDFQQIVELVVLAELQLEKIKMKIDVQRREKDRKSVV